MQKLFVIFVLVVGGFATYNLLAKEQDSDAMYASFSDVLSLDQTEIHLILLPTGSDEYSCIPEYVTPLTNGIHDEMAGWTLKGPGMSYDGLGPIYVDCNFQSGFYTVTRTSDKMEYGKFQVIAHF